MSDDIHTIATNDGGCSILWKSSICYPVESIINHSNGLCVVKLTLEKKDFISQFVVQVRILIKSSVGDKMTADELLRRRKYQFRPVSMVKIV